MKRFFEGGPWVDVERAQVLIKEILGPGWSAKLGIDNVAKFLESGAWKTPLADGTMAAQLTDAGWGNAQGLLNLVVDEVGSRAVVRSFSFGSADSAPTFGRLFNGHFEAQLSADITPSAAAAALAAASSAADLNGDGTVGPEDYTLWANAVGTAGDDLAADLNGDGLVDTADYDRLLENWDTAAEEIQEFQLFLSEGGEGGPTPLITVGDVQVIEPPNSGDSLGFGVRVTLSETTDVAVTFDWVTAEILALNPEDFTGPTTLQSEMIPANTLFVDLPVTVEGDEIDEFPTEFFQVAITNVVNAGAGDYVGDVTILDDDANIDVDLDTDSNHDGTIDAADDANEAADPGRILLVNDDDDNANSLADMDDSGVVTGEDELAQVTLALDTTGYTPAQLTGYQVRLEASEGAGLMKVWDSALKGNEIVLAPATSTWAYDAFPGDVYVEGRDTGRAMLDLVLLDPGGGEVRRDSNRFTILAMDVELPGEQNADTQEAYAGAVFTAGSDLDLPDAVDGFGITFIMSHLQGGSDFVTTTVADGGAAAAFATGTQPGDTYEALAIFLGTTRRSNTLTVTPGEPFSIGTSLIEGPSWNPSVQGFVSDGTGWITIEVEVLDQFFRAVADGTTVTWIVEDPSSVAFEGGAIDTETTDGIARLDIRAPDLAVGQTIRIIAGDVEVQKQIDATPATVDISGVSTLDVFEGESGTITLTADVADGTPVMWTTSNGEFTSPSGTIIDQGSQFVYTTVIGGTATIDLSATGQWARVGEAHVTATVGGGLVHQVVDFTWKGISANTAEILLLTDTTGSMLGPIQGVQSIFSDLVQTFDTAFWALADYRDVGDSGYSDGWEVQHTFSDDVTSLTSAVNSLSIGDGADPEEQQLAALSNAANSWTTTLGGDASGPTTRIILWAGDQSGHAGGQYPSLSSTISDLQAAGVTVIGLNFGTAGAGIDGAGGQATQIVGATEGTLFNNVSTSTTPQIEDAISEIGVESSDDFFIELERLVISGDVTEDGSEQLDYLADVTPPHGEDIHADWAGLTANDVDYHATTKVTVHGPAGVTYDLDFSDPAHANFVQFEDMSGSPISSITIPEEGPGEVVLRSLGAFDGDTATVDFQNVEIVVREANPPGGGTPDEFVETLQLTEHVWWTRTWDAVQGFFGGDPETVAGIAGNVAGGIFIVGDVGSVIKNVWRMTPFSSTDPNYTETALSALGLATELAVGVGEVADVPISTARALVAAVGKGAFSEAIVIVLKRGLQNVTDLKDLGVFLTKMVSSSNFFQFSKAVFKSEELLTAGQKFIDDFTEGAGAIGVDDAIRGLVAVAEEATLGGTKVAGQISKVIADLPAEKVAFLKNLAGSDLAEFDTVITSMAKAIHQGKIDPELLKRILDADIYSTGYTAAQAMKDLGTLAEAGVGNLYKAAKSMTNAGNGRWGFAYEVRVAAQLVDDGKMVTFISKLVPARTIDGIDFTRTDIDIVADGVYYQVKRSKAAFLGGQSNAKALVKTRQWVKKATEDAKASGINPVVIKYVTQDIAEVPALIKSFLDKKMIEVLPIAGPVPPP